ncbi:STAS domain-containing protein [Myxococcota bacterium]|nr:STAS domain-containing protein [Myxococcota bacterium]
MLAGCSVAAVAVPQAMAYAMIAGLPVEYGLYTAIVMTAIGAVLDSSRQLINGPTNAISIALLSAIGAVVEPDARIQAAVLMAFLIGVIQVLIALARLGDLTRFISHSVIVGFTAGASLLLVLDQAKNLLGLRAMGDVHDHFLVRFARTLAQGGPVHVPTLAVGLGAIAMVLGLRALKRWRGWTLLPELLVVVAVMAGVSAAVDLQGMGVKVVGPIPAALPSFQVPHLELEQVRSLATSALAIGLLGLLEAIAMAKAIAATTRQKLDLNQQCLSEGMANLGGSFFQCMPGSGSLTRSAINQQAGGRTQWSGVVSAAAVAAITLVFAPYAEFIPRSALAGILILTAGKMIHLGDLRFHLRASRFDAIIVTATAVSAFAISIEFCVLIGVFLSFMLAVPRIGQMRLTEFVVTPEGGVHERLQTDETCGHVRIYSLEGEMFFGAAESLAQHLEDIEEAAQGGTRVILLRVKRARSPDAVGMAQLQGFLERMAGRGVHVALTGVRPDFLATLEGSGLRARLAEDQLYLDLPVRKTATARAVEQLIDRVGEPCPRCPREVRERIRDRIEV